MGEYSDFILSKEASKTISLPHVIKAFRSAIFNYIRPKQKAAKSEDGTYTIYKGDDDWYCLHVMASALGWQYMQPDGRSPDENLNSLKNYIRSDILHDLFLYDAFERALTDAIDKLIKGRENRLLPVYSVSYMNELCDAIAFQKGLGIVIDSINGEELIEFQEFIALCQAKTLLGKWVLCGNSEQPTKTTAPAEVQIPARTAEKQKKPKGMTGFFCEKILQEPEPRRTAILSTKQGDSTFYGLARKWQTEYREKKGSAPEHAESALSNAKKYCKKEFGIIEN